jgi:membrane protein implicated in regulation of membrane protease activity
MLLFEVADSNLIFGLPETADLLIFGLVLIFLTVALRRFFGREKRKSDS